MSSNWPKAGFKHTPSYLVSGIPYVTSSNNNDAPGAGGTPIRISFPFVTKWVCIRSTDTAGTPPRHLRIGFTELGVKNNTNCIQIPDQNTPQNPGFGLSDPVLEVACTELFISSDVAGRATEFTLIAGLTNIPAQSFPTLTGSLGYTGVG